MLYNITTNEIEWDGEEVILTADAEKLMLAKCQGIINAIKGRRWDAALEKAQWLSSSLELLSAIDHCDD